MFFKQNISFWNLLLLISYADNKYIVTKGLICICYRRFKTNISSTEWLNISLIIVRPQGWICLLYQETIVECDLPGSSTYSEWSLECLCFFLEVSNSFMITSFCSWILNKSVCDSRCPSHDHCNEGEVWICYHAIKINFELRIKLS